MSNKFYQDFINDHDNCRQFIPAFSSVNRTELLEKIVTLNTIHKSVGQILYRQNEDSDSPYLKLLTDDTVVYIVTGQQLGLLASPLYTIYKALTAVKLAESLNKDSNAFTYVPVFWLECEDHDFQEINHFHIWNRENEILKITYQGEEQLKQSIKHYHVTSDIQEVINSLKTNLIQTEFSDSIVDVISKCYTSGRNWIDATHDYMQYVLKQTGILYFNPGDTEIKKLASAFFTNWIENLPQIMQAFAEQSSILLQEGYPNQVSDIKGKTFVHLVNSINQREHLYYEGNSFYTGKEKLNLSLKEIHRYVIDNPENISTSVVSRPLLQSWLLPTFAYVAGPAEIAYWAQLGNIFKVLDLEMPVVYPRMSITLIEPRINRFMEKNRIKIEDITAGEKQFLENYFKEQLNQESKNPFMETKAQIDIQFEKIKTYIGGIDKTLLNVADKGYQNMMQQLEFLENKTVRASQAGEEITLKQLRQIHGAFFPEDTLQERILSIVYYLNKFGPVVVDRIYEQSLLGVPHPQHVYL
jgi:bacillithiol biosynthesis cysteine-adding enzyme BshC